MKSFRRKLAFLLSLLLVITAVRYDFNTARADGEGGGEASVSGNDAILSVGFRPDQQTGLIHGQVSYSVDRTQWVPVTQDTEGIRVTTTSTNKLYLRIEPESSNYRIDYAGTRVSFGSTSYQGNTNNDPNPIPADVQSALGNTNGYEITVGSNNMAVSLSSVEFRYDDSGSNPPPGGGGTPATLNLQVTFAETTSHGKVQYSLDNRTTWNNVTGNQTLDLNVPYGGVAIRIEPDSGYRVNWTGMTYQADGTVYDLSDDTNSPIFGPMTGTNPEGQPNAYDIDAARITNAKLLNVNFVEGNPDQGGGGGQNQPRPNAVASVSMNSTNTDWTGPACVYERDQQHNPENDYVIWNAQRDNSWSKAGISINHGQTVYFHDEDNNGRRTPVANRTIEYYEGNDEITTVDMTFSFNWGYRPMGTTVKINNEDYNIPVNFSDEVSWLNAFSFEYRNQDISFTISGVPKVENYNVVLDLRPITWDECFIGNFLWWDSDNADITLIKATYPSRLESGRVFGATVLAEESDVRPKEAKTAKYITYGHDDRDGVGEMVLPVGTQVTMRVAAPFGHQVTAFTVNGREIDPDDVGTNNTDVAQFTFTITEGNFHLHAIVDEVQNACNAAAAQDILDGNVELGGREPEMAIGTATLKLADINPDSELTAAFAAKAEGYTVEDYVDVSLFNTVYKGTANATWDTPVHTLNNPATIYLQMDEDLTGKEVMILHEKADGTVETIPATVETIETDEGSFQILVFQTTSFSNYGIAVKETETNTNTETNTGSTNSGSTNTGSTTTDSNVAGPAEDGTPAKEETVVAETLTSKVKNGTKAVTVEVTPASVTPADKEIIKENTPAGWNLNGTYNLTTNGKVNIKSKSGKLVLDIPASLQKAGRTFAVVLLENGKHPIVLADIDSSDNSITVSLKKRTGCTFAIIYTDEPNAKIHGTYIVRKGDNMSYLANMWGYTLKELARKNNLKNLNRIRINQKIVY